MFYECDETNCIIGTEYCTNRSFEDLRKRCKAGGKYNIGVEVIKTMDRGHGVRSNRTFNSNQIIVEYTGEIITQDECDNRMRKMYKDNEVMIHAEFHAIDYADYLAVLLPYGFRPEHDYRRYSRFDSSIYQSFL